MAGLSLHDLRGLEYSLPSNGTAGGLSQLPTSLLDAVLPGYSFISRYILQTAGLDISLLVSIVVLSVACTTALRYVYHEIWTYILSYSTTSVVIEEYDNIFDQVVAWAAEHGDLKKVRALRVQSADHANDVDRLPAGSVEQDGAIFNFKNWAAQIPPRYEPDTGSHWFRHRGHWFIFSREKIKLSRFDEHETITLTAIGRSTGPLKDLIWETRERELATQTTRTTVRRPSAKQHRGAGRSAWVKVAVRPSRPMSTVVLDDGQKAAILRDINDFMDPATCRWYSSRGIPYRRGYLLTGPPGTGKTSLSFALGGVFGLDIYCVSLSDKGISEEDLMLLLNSLPKRCIVLLEDIDTAGVLQDTRPRLRKNRKTDRDAGQAWKRSWRPTNRDGPRDRAPTAEVGADGAQRAGAASGRTAVGDGYRIGGGRGGTKDREGGIPLSGLLNAIDGVSSQEGRVLIMTTNQPECLDEALIRPGRVDLTIHFRLASRPQMRALFVRMYDGDADPIGPAPKKLHEILPARLDGASVRDHGHAGAVTAESGADAPWPQDQSECPDRLEEMANRFAGRLPEGTFSPADIQGFLLRRRREPGRALAEVVRWRDGELARRRGSRSGSAQDGRADSSERGPAGREKHACSVESDRALTAQGGEMVVSTEREIEATTAPDLYCSSAGSSSASLSCDSSSSYSSSTSSNRSDADSDGWVGSESE